MFHPVFHKKVRENQVVSLLKKGELLRLKALSGHMVYDHV